MRTTVIALNACLLFATALAAGERPASDQLSRQVTELIAALDAPQFDARSRASAELAKLCDQEDLRQPLADQIGAALLSTELSFEARTQLGLLARRLPPPRLMALTAATAEIDRLLSQLDDDVAGVRLGAEARLLALADQHDTNMEVMLALKRLLAQVDVDAATRDKARELLDRARGVWLLSDRSTWRLPEVSDEQIRAWVEALAKAPSADRKLIVAREAAQRELVDLLARDEYVGRVRSAIEERLNDKKLDLEVVKQLETVNDWTRPAMVAEYWQGAETRAGVEHRGIQYVLIGVPSVPEGGVRATHFDRIDDKVAHCASGNSLSPGDYPVDVFFPHPQQGGAQFHLINLPTPLRRFAYEYQVRVDDRIRSREITGRTLDRILQQKKPLSQSEILMLEELDDGQVSAFAGRYLMSVDDSNYPPPEAQFVGNLSRHLNFCCMLARSGRHEAIPGLMQAIKAKRFLDPPSETPYDWPWVAALCIAVHDPWPEVDQFLIDLVQRDQPLMLNAANRQTTPAELPAAPNDTVPEPKTPELGATAASVLLSRHGIPPSVFGLEVLMYSPLVSLDCPGAYFRDPKNRASVLNWWNEQKQQARSAGE